MSRSWNYSLEGYLDPDTGEQITNEPPTGYSTDGVFVHAWDKNDPENDRWFWVYKPDLFDSWEDMHHWIEQVGEGYGIEF